MKPAEHKAFVHHDFKNRVLIDDKRIKELVVECTACDFVQHGFTRRPEAKAAGLRHEKEANHQ